MSKLYKAYISSYRMDTPDWDNYLKALKDIGYDGFLTIERECGEDPVKDIFKAADFIREKLTKI